MQIMVAIDRSHENTRSFNYSLLKDEICVVSLSIEYLVDVTCDKNNLHAHHKDI